MKIDNYTEHLSKSECGAMKGLAILSIMLHNLCHLMPTIARGTNEFFYEQRFADNLRSYLHHVDGNWFMVLGSFLGQFGVQVFLFLSAYGLVMKYEKGAAPVGSKWGFISHHYLKLFRLMIIGLIVAILLGWGINSLSIAHFRVHFMSHPQYWIPQLFMITNLLPYPDVNIYPGPFWYLGVTFEAYVVYRLFLYVPQDAPSWRGWLPVLIFMIVTWIPQLIWGPEGDIITYMRYNVLIAGVPFSMGLLMARYFKIPRLGRPMLALLLVGAVVAFMAMQFNYHLWLWSSIFFIIIVATVVRLCSAPLMKPLVWVGALSSAIFIVHPIVRIFFFTWDWWPASQNHFYFVLLVYALLSIAVAMAYSKLVAKLPSPKQVTQYR